MVHSAFAAMATAAAQNTSRRRSMRATSSEASMAPSDRPPRSAPATRPTSTSLKPSRFTQAVLMTGMPTSTP